MTLKQLVEDADTRPGRIFDWTVLGLIVISLISFCLETLPDLSPETTFWLYVVEVVTVGLFTLEYFLRIIVASNRPRFLFSFYGLVDLVAVLPFYITVGIDLRAIRVLRLLRVFRVLKFFRYTKALDRLRRAFSVIKEELIIYLFATGLIVFVSSVGIYYCERDAQPEVFSSIFHSLWWSVVTLTTVGYGDAVPVTVGASCLRVLS